ncbi:MAG: hypothetical protein R3B70_25615 [Polyangiaceae bacterium]
MIGGAGVSLFWLTADGSGAGPFFGGATTTVLRGPRKCGAGCGLQCSPGFTCGRMCWGGRHAEAGGAACGAEVATFGAVFVAPSPSVEAGFP